ncbi:hypothetical protein [uncultured Marinobacter sp.]|uniref:hypothetical protein n=1 Tax=uncultured Marinobacter sp. TaxID=187379 RepID=UPI0025998BD0|nr:hypothetical protein [uncultured Marinobacter sp.]
MPIDARYHITVFDESGAVIHYDDLDREAMDEFRMTHMDDDLDYAIEYGIKRGGQIHE